MTDDKLICGVSVKFVAPMPFLNILISSRPDQWNQLCYPMGDRIDTTLCKIYTKAMANLSSSDFLLANAIFNMSFFIPDPFTAEVTLS